MTRRLIDNGVFALTIGDVSNLCTSSIIDVTEIVAYRSILSVAELRQVAGISVLEGDGGVPWPVVSGEGDECRIEVDAVYLHSVDAVEGV